jgi:hypothetical protein
MVLNYHVNDLQPWIIIAFYVSLFLVIVSLRFVKPNFSDNPTISEPSNEGIFSIGQEIDKRS